MYSGQSLRVLLMVGFSFSLCEQAISASIHLHNEPDVLVGNGTGASGGGMLNGTVAFSSSIVTTNANNEDSALFQTIDNVVRTWIDDASDNQSDWTSTFQLEFTQPINGIKIVPDSPQNNSDSVVWNVRWTGSSNEATFVNSPNRLNEYSLYENGSRLRNGSFNSGTVFRFDDDATFGGDANGTTPNDHNIQRPAIPWSIDLPDEITSLTIQAQVAAGEDLNLSREGFGVDFSTASIVPEPESVGTTALLLTFVYYRRRLCRD